ncbi:MAG TPA: LLM class flavin-dependent oxidoreductase [Dehalococcoidia bacterium]|nr:LLM class flavin-dependent oxidoreductase [Dehalococcoidia bacterium]
MAVGIGLFGPYGDFPALAAATRQAEALGIDAVLFGEHHGAPQNRFPALLNLLSALAACTNTIRLGTSVVLSALENPVRLAEEAAQVDVISGGRLILGLGLGYQPADFQHFGVPFAQRRSRFEEGIEVLRRAWSERPFSFSGRRYRFDAVSVYPLPVQQPRPPLWLAGWTPAGVRRAARLGDAWVTDPIQSRAALCAMGEEYRAACAAAGATPRTVLMREILIAPSRDQALARYGPGLLATYRYYWRNGAFNTEWDAWARAITAPEQITLEAVLRERVIAGSPADCADQIRDWVAATGAEYVQLVIPARPDLPGTDPDAIALIGRELLPALRDR